MPDRILQQVPGSAPIPTYGARGRLILDRLSAVTLLLGQIRSGCRPGCAAPGQSQSCAAVEEVRPLPRRTRAIVSWPGACCRVRRVTPGPAADSALPTAPGLVSYYTTTCAASGSLVRQPPAGTARPGFYVTRRHPYRLALRQPPPPRAGGQRASTVGRRPSAPHLVGPFPVISR